MADEEIADNSEDKLERDKDKPKGELVPPEKPGAEGGPPRVVQEMMATMMHMSGGGRVAHPIFDKFKDEHVLKFLDQSHEEDLFRLQTERHGRWFALAYSLIAILFIGLLIVFLLPENKDLLTEILKLGITFLGGVGSGYGLKSHLERRRRD